MIENFESLFEKAIYLFAESYNKKIAPLSEWNSSPKELEVKKFNVFFEIVGEKELNFFLCVEEDDFFKISKELAFVEEKVLDEMNVACFCELGNIFLGHLGPLFSSEKEIFQYSPPLFITGKEIFFKSADNDFKYRTFSFETWKMTFGFSYRY